MSKRVLIVDDEANILLSLEFLMKQAGYEVVTAGDGDAAIAAIRESAPDLVLLDIMIPGRNGYEVCEWLRADTGHTGPAVVMLTARGRDIEREKGLSLGADAYVTKPFSTREVSDTVKRLLDARPA